MQTDSTNTKLSFPRRPRQAFGLNLSQIMKHVDALHDSYEKIHTKYHGELPEPSKSTPGEVVSALTAKKTAHSEDLTEKTTTDTVSATSTQETKATETQAIAQSSQLNDSSSSSTAASKATAETQLEIDSDEEKELKENQPNFWLPVLVLRKNFPRLEKKNDEWLPPDSLKPENCEDKQIYNKLLALIKKLESIETNEDRLEYLHEERWVKEKSLSFAESRALDLIDPDPVHHLWKTVQDVMKIQDGSKEGQDIKDIFFLGNDEFNGQDVEPEADVEDDSNEKDLWLQSEQVTNNPELEELYNQIIQDGKFFNKNDLIQHLMDNNLITEQKEAEAAWAPHLEFAEGYFPAYKGKTMRYNYEDYPNAKAVQNNEQTEVAQAEQRAAADIDAKENKEDDIAKNLSKIIENKLKNRHYRRSVIISEETRNAAQTALKLAPAKSILKTPSQDKKKEKTEKKAHFEINLGDGIKVTKRQHWIKAEAEKSKDQAFNDDEIYDEYEGYTDYQTRFVKRAPEKLSVLEKLSNPKKTFNPSLNFHPYPESDSDSD